MAAVPNSCISFSIVIDTRCPMYAMPTIAKADTLRASLSSDIIIRTHKHRSTNKREPLFRGNHRWHLPLVNC